MVLEHIEQMTAINFDRQNLRCFISSFTAIKFTIMKREADEETEPTPYPNKKRHFTSRNEVTPDNEADIQDGTTNENVSSILAALQPATLQRFKEKVSTTEGARDLIDQLIPEICKQMNIPHGEVVERAEMLKDLYFPEAVSLPLVNFR